MSRPEIQPEDIAAVVEVLKSGTLSLGAAQQAFETAFADYIGTKHAVAVSSGTAGLHLCMRVLDIAPGDEVITSPFGFVSSANAILYEGGKPVFADIDEDTLSFTAQTASQLVTGRTRALLPVHVFGQPGDLDGYLDLADRRGIALVEDACEALGTVYRGRKVGGFGQTAVFSFYPNKQITTGEGAIITTNDDAIAAHLRSLRNQGRDEMGTWLDYVRLGYNYRLDEMSAALGLSQLRRVESQLEKRARVATAYRRSLADLAGVRLPAVLPTTSRMSWFVFVIRLEEGIDRDRIARRLQARGIPSRAYFSPLHLQPYMREKFGFKPGDFPVTEKVSASTLALPFHGGLEESEIELVVNGLRDAIAAG